MESGERQCHFPSWLQGRGHHKKSGHGRKSPGHSEWASVEDGARLHVNRKGHSMRIRNLTEEAAGVAGQDQPVVESEDAHATCHQAEMLGPRRARVVAHVRRGW